MAIPNFIIQATIAILENPTVRSFLAGVAKEIAVDTVKELMPKNTLEESLTDDALNDRLHNSLADYLALDGMSIAENENSACACGESCANTGKH